MLLASSALAFNVVKYAGAAYLIYLGLRNLLSGEEPQTRGPAVPRTLRRIFLQGVVVNVLNPKTALFFLAFLPQFVNPSKGAVLSQILILGGSFVLLGVCSDGLWALLAGTVGDAIKRSGRFLRGQRYVTGGVYLGLGVAAAVTGSDRTH